MTAFSLEISSPPPPAEEPLEAVVVDDLEALASDAATGCGDDNPYN
ncbi:MULTISPECIES: hypothetical protein [Streptomyces]|nr:MULTISPECIES: hypothetical protein [Streptomyces]